MTDIRSILFVLLVLVPAGFGLVGFLYMLGCVLRSKPGEEDQDGFHEVKGRK